MNLGRFVQLWPGLKTTSWLNWGPLFNLHITTDLVKGDRYAKYLMYRLNKRSSEAPCGVKKLKKRSKIIKLEWERMISEGMTEKCSFSLLLCWDQSLVMKGLKDKIPLSHRTVWESSLGNGFMFIHPLQGSRISCCFLITTEREHQKKRDNIILFPIPFPSPDWFLQRTVQRDAGRLPNTNQGWLLKNVISDYASGFCPPNANIWCNITVNL